MADRFHSRRRVLCQLTALGALPWLAAPIRGRAQGLLRQLTLVVGFPAGGATDQAARLVAAELRGRFAEVVVVDNRAGANGRIASAAVKNGPSDGSMMLFTPAFPLAIFPHIYPSLPYDPLTDFVPVATTSKGAFVLSVGPAVPAEVKTLADFVAWCNAHPDQASFGAPAGGGQHFAGVIFSRQSGAPLRMVNYKGGAPSVVDCLGGHIASVVTPIPEVIQFARDGKLRMLATTTSERTRAIPDVPTMKESGYDVVFQDWSGLVAPARTPPDVVARVNALIDEAMRSRGLNDALARIGFEPDLNTPDQFAALYRQTWEKYREVVKATGFKAED